MMSMSMEAGKLDTPNYDSPVAAESYVDQNTVHEGKTLLEQGM